MIPSWDTMTEWGRDPYSDAWYAENDWYADDQTFNVPASSGSSEAVQVAGLQNGNGWTESFKHAALAGGLGAVGGLLFGPIGAVGGLLTALVMSSSVLQSHAKEVALLNNQHMNTRSKTREDEERRSRERVERERGAREREMREVERRRRDEEWRLRRQEEWNQFVAAKKNDIADALKQYKLQAVNVAIIGRSRTVIEVPWHVPWQLRRQLADALESAVQMHVAFVPVRFCDGCGGKLAGPMADAPQCPMCARTLFDTQPASASHITSHRPTHTTTRKEPVPIPAPAVPVSIATIVGEDTVEEEDTAELAAAETFNSLAEYQSEDPLEVEDYAARMELEKADLPEVLKRLLATNEKMVKPHINIKKEPVQTTTAASPQAGAKAEPSTATVKTAIHLADAPAPKAKEGNKHGTIEEDKRVRGLGPYKNLTGTVQLLNSKKHKAKVLLDDFGTTVNIAIDLLEPLEATTQ